MSLWLLDTDTVSFVLSNHPLVNQVQNNPKLSKNKLQKDMRIASIALANNAIVVTRNHRDFSQVPGLTIVDWTQ